MKQCRKCKISKPLTEFHKNRSEKDGLQRHCKDCTRVLQGSKGTRRCATQGNAQDAPSDAPDALADEIKSSHQPDRYQVLRQHSRGSGRCCWKVFDTRAHTTVYLADCLRDALEHIDELIEADRGFKVGFKYGRPVTIENSDTNEDNEDLDLVGQDDLDEAEVFA